MLSRALARTDATPLRVRTLQYMDLTLVTPRAAGTNRSRRRTRAVDSVRQSCQRREFRLRFTVAYARELSDRLADLVDIVDDAVPRPRQRGRHHPNSAHDALPHSVWVSHLRAAQGGHRVAHDVSRQTGEVHRATADSAQYGAGSHRLPHPARAARVQLMRRRTDMRAGTAAKRLALRELPRARKGPPTGSRSHQGIPDLRVPFIVVQSAGRATQLRRRTH